MGARNRSCHTAGTVFAIAIRKTTATLLIFPKSLYSTKDSIANIVRNNPNALILDFFAVSGTTLHAVNLLNSEDGGHRRCILVTNNECSDTDAALLHKTASCYDDQEAVFVSVFQDSFVQTSEPDSARI